MKKEKIKDKLSTLHQINHFLKRKIDSDENERRKEK